LAHGDGQHMVTIYSSSDLSPESQITGAAEFEFCITTWHVSFNHTSLLIRLSPALHFSCCHSANFPCVNQSINLFFFFVDTAQLIHTSDLLSKTLCNGFGQEVIIWVNENMLGLHSVTVYSEHIFGGKMQVSGIFFLTWLL